MTQNQLKRNFKRFLTNGVRMLLDRNSAIGGLDKDMAIDALLDVANSRLLNPKVKVKNEKL